MKKIEAHKVTVNNGVIVDFRDADAFMKALEDYEVQRVINTDSLSLGIKGIIVFRLENKQTGIPVL